MSTIRRLTTPILAVALMAGSAALLFHLFQRQISNASFAIGSHPEVMERLAQSLGDQRRLAEIDAESAELYRARFAEIETTVHRLQILEHNRSAITERYETLMLVAFLVCVVLVTGVYAVRQSRHQPRLARLQEALTGLAEGRTDLEIGDRARDTIGQIALMIERTSRLIARDRQRIAALDNLSAWQEAARRHAHEMRTPLTGLQLELDRARDLLGRSGDDAVSLRPVLESARQEAARLVEFTSRFTSFARLPAPKTARHELSALVTDFAQTYRAAWPRLAFEIETEPDVRVQVDRDQLRQVLVNLCDNAAAAAPAAGGVVRIASGRSEGWAWIDVSDDGPGISPAVQNRLFEPYSTTRGIGEGMGLGLAICRKILLDHGGDLELMTETEERSGATFRMRLPTALESEPGRPPESVPAGEEGAG